MADLLNKGAIEICTEAIDGSLGRGSGFPVGNGLIMTCAHVVAEKKCVWVRWCEFDDEMALPEHVETKEFDVEVKTHGSNSRRFIKASVRFCGEVKTFDVALLEVFHPSGFGYFQLSRFDGSVGDLVGGIGFPRATTDKLFRSVALNGKVDQAPSYDKGMLLQIRLDDGLENPSDWRGASGAPVFCLKTNTVIGVHRITGDYKPASNTVWAIASSTIWAHPELSAILLEAACDTTERNRAFREHHRRYRDLVELKLETLSERELNRLEKGLKIDVPKNASIPECARHLTENVDSALNVLSVLWNAYSTRPEKNIWTDLVRLVAACSLREDEAALLILGPHNAIPEELAAGNPVALEVSAAQIDGRYIALLEERASEADMPAGKTALNLHAAESGPGGDLDTVASERDVLLRLGWRMKTRPKEVESYLAREPLLSGARRVPLSEDDRRELAGVFRRRRIDAGAASFYMAHLLKLIPQEQARMEKIVQYFREHYPAVMIIPLDREKWDQHGDRYATLINTVPVLKGQQGK